MRIIRSYLATVITVMFQDQSGVIRTAVPDLKQSSYVIVSPVKDEERYIEATLRSVIGQTVRPLKWIIVDDGSSDATPQILQSVAKLHNWIEVLRIQREAIRDLGITEIKAFAKGYEQLNCDEFDFIVKLDCDLDLPPDYFERLLKEFEKNKRLGIASGMYLEDHDGKWLPAHMPDYHAAGASKMVRRSCFEEINGFILYRGWDTIDEIKAMTLEWETRHFRDLTFRHLKREGSAMGFGRTNALHGEIYYLTGGGIVFFLLKVLHRTATSMPPVLAGAAMLWGYLRCPLQGKKRLVSRSEAKFYRTTLNRRLLGQLQRVLSRAGAKGEVWSND